MVQDQDPQSLTIGRLSAAGGVGVETVRFYQRKGLLTTPKREGGVRRYNADDLRRLRFIRRAQTAGFTLAEIKELLVLDAGEDRLRAQELAASRIQSLDAKIVELQSARDALARLARACHASSSGPCPILASFDT